MRCSISLNRLTKRNDSTRHNKANTTKAVCGSKAVNIQCAKVKAVARYTVRCKRCQLLRNIRIDRLLLVIANSKKINNAIHPVNSGSFNTSQIRYIHNPISFQDKLGCEMQRK